MNVIAIMNHMGVYFKEEPIRELHRALERLDFRIVYPNDRDDLLKLIENNSRLCGVIFDWDKYNLELCEEIRTSTCRCMRSLTPTPLWTLA